MANIVFDNGVNQGGTGDNTWEDDTNWFGGAKPVANDDVQISADCTVVTDYSAIVFETLLIDAGDTLTVGNGADVRFDTDASTVNGTLHLDTGGTIYFTNVNLTITVTTGVLELDGGVLHFIETDSTKRFFIINGGITGTANTSGTDDIQLDATNNQDIELQLNAAGASIVGDSVANKIGIDGFAGANQPMRGNITSAAIGFRIVNCLFDDIDRITIGQIGEMENCVHQNTSTTEVDEHVYVGGVVVYFTNCTYDGAAVAAANVTSGGDATFTNCTFGAGAANAVDISVAGGSKVSMHNTLLTNAEGGATDVKVFGPASVVSTAHNNDREHWHIWRGYKTTDVVHQIQGETTVVHGASRQAIKIITHASTSTDRAARLDFVLAAWPATHGDTLDVTIYVKGATGAKIWVIVDPDSIYGTTQSDEYTYLAAPPADEWQQITVPQYTVNTNAAEQMGIPIIIRVEEASKTWYVDTLAVTT